MIRTLLLIAMIVCPSVSAASVLEMTYSSFVKPNGVKSEESEEFELILYFDTSTFGEFGVWRDPNMSGSVRVGEEVVTFKGGGQIRVNNQFPGSPDRGAFLIDTVGALNPIFSGTIKSQEITSIEVIYRGIDLFVDTPTSRFDPVVPLNSFSSNSTGLSNGFANSTHFFVNVLNSAKLGSTSDITEGGFTYSARLLPTPVPVPASGWLLMGGLAGLGFLRRRLS